LTGPFFEYIDKMVGTGLDLSLYWLHFRKYRKYFRVVFETRREGASLPGLPVCRMGDVPQRHVSTGGRYLWFW